MLLTIICRYDWSNTKLSSVDCRSESIHKIFGTDLFLCFTVSVGDAHRQSAAALSAILYLHDHATEVIDKYDPLADFNTKATRGLRLHVHEAGTFPDVNRGFDISPGTSVTLDLNKKVISRLSKPHGSCTNAEHLVEDGDTYSSINYKYTTDAAIDQCQQLETIRQCGCVHPKLPITPLVNATVWRDSVASCYELPGGSGPQSLQQTIANIECFRTISYGDACAGFETPPCTENAYTFAHHATAWPHEGYELAFYKQHIKHISPLRARKFGRTFREYDSIASLLGDTEVGSSSENISAVLDRLKQEKLIERNFIQLSIRFKVQ